MLSLRLAPEHDLAVTSIAKRLGLSRSAWLRQLIEQGIAQNSAPDAYARYLEVMRGVDVKESATHTAAAGHRARDHSQLIKTKLRRAHDGTVAV
jgi:predicted DNA-binding protein